MPRVAACLIAYNDGRFLDRVMQPFFPNVYRLGLLGTKPWGNPDALYSLEVMGWNAEVSDYFSQTVEKYWETEHEQRNEGLQILHGLGFDYVWFLDADEVYSRESVAGMLRFIDSNHGVDVYRIAQRLYWKDESHRLVLNEVRFSAPAVVKSTFRFSDLRNYDTGKYSAYEVPADIAVCDHYSYVRSDKEMQRKISTFSHKREIRKDWFEEVWLKWTPEMENLHPVNPPSFRKAVLV